MVKILLANNNIEKDLKLFQTLADCTGFKLVTANNGLSTIKKYLEFRPDIFILYTNLKDINYLKILQRVSQDSNIEKTNCNVILINDTPNESIHITDVSKLYKIFYTKPELQEILNIVKEMSDYALDGKIDLLFLETKISLSSSPSDRVRYALRKCYYNPNLTANIDELFNIVARDFDTTGDGIRSSFRTALSRLNLYKDKGNHPFEIYKFFENGEDVTPKTFLDIAVYYLKNKKQ